MPALFLQLLRLLQQMKRDVRDSEAPDARPARADTTVKQPTILAVIQQRQLLLLLQQQQQSVQLASHPKKKVPKRGSRLQSSYCSGC